MKCFIAYNENFLLGETSKEVRLYPFTFVMDSRLLRIGICTICGHRAYCVIYRRLNVPVLTKFTCFQPVTPLCRSSAFPSRVTSTSKIHHLLHFVFFENNYIALFVLKCVFIMPSLRGLEPAVVAKIKVDG